MLYMAYQFQRIVDFYRQFGIRMRLSSGLMKR